MRTNPPSIGNFMPGSGMGSGIFLLILLERTIIEMKKYESPFCEMETIEQDKSFLQSVTASSDDYPVTQVDPFHSRGLWEEDGDE